MKKLSIFLLSIAFSWGLSAQDGTDSPLVKGREFLGFGLTAELLSTHIGAAVQNTGAFSVGLSGGHLIKDRTGFGLAMSYGLQKNKAPSP